MSAKKILSNAKPITYFIVGCLLLCVELLLIFRQGVVYQENTITQPLRILHITHRIEQGFLQLNPQSCRWDENCRVENVVIADQLRRDIVTLEQVAGNENQWLNVTAIQGLQLLSLRLQRFLMSRESIVDLQLTEQQKNQILYAKIQLESLLESRLLEERNDYWTLHGALVLLAMMFFLLSFNAQTKRFKREAKTQQIVREKFSSVCRSILRWDKVSLADKLLSDDVSTIERRIYGKIIAMLDNQESHYEQMDLYRSLYSMVGYEIRGISNTIKGGIKVLTRSADEADLFLAYEVSSAVQTLEELAENFNSLLSMGSQDHSDNINISQITSDLSLGLAAQNRRQGLNLECFIDPSLPSSVYGNQIGLFWMLLLKFSNAITSTKNKKTLFTVTSQSGESIENITLQFELYTLTDDQLTLSDIAQLPWTHRQYLSDSSDKLSDHLLKGMDHKVVWWQADESTRVQVNIDVTPHRYAAVNKSLVGKRLLLCGDSPLQRDIISKTLGYYGVEIDHAISPNDIFRKISNEYDTVLITDTIPGIDLPSFTRSIHKRLVNKKTLLFVSIANPDMAEGLHNFVHHIFYRPIDTYSFINKMSQEFANVEQTLESASKKVLVVEDDELQQLILSHLLADIDIATDCVDSGEKAIEYIEEHRPDVVFMDCIMPGMGGIEATRIIKENSRNNAHSITIIGATGLTGTKDKKQCIDAGMDYVVNKPYDDDEIKKVLQNYMAIKKIN